MSTGESTILHCVRKLLAGLAAALLLAGCQPKAPEAPDNLVVICLDTVRYDAFLQRDVNDALTPWLDKALLFSDTTSAAPWTMPSVSTVLTGLYPVEHGAGQFQAPVANLDTELPSPLDPSAVTLAEILDKRHFRTGGFVSHPFFMYDLGLRQGFQQVHNRRGWQRDEAKFWEWAERIHAPDRFFGYLHFMEAHHRHTQSDQALGEFLAKQDPATLDYLAGLHPANCAERDSDRCRQNLVYDVSVLDLRTAVATLLNELQKRNLLDKTLVLVYSDHGEEFWDHEAEELKHGGDPRESIGLGHGQSMYQELLHVPLLVWHPHMPGAVYATPVSLVDVLPSLLTWMHIDTEDLHLKLSGEPLPPLQGRHWFGKPKDRTLYASGIAYGPQQVATRRGSLKSIFHLQDDSFEFYDLAADPREQAPLSDSGLVLEFDTVTGDYLDRQPIAQFAASKLDAKQIESLKAIGYLQGVNEPQEPNAQGEQQPPQATEEDDKDGGEQP